MGLSYKSRRRLALLLLIVWLPLYIVAAITIVSWFDRPSILVELLIYICLGFVWVLPFKSVFKGVGQQDPAPPSEDK